MLNISNVNAGYGDLKVLYDISLEVKDGEVVSLVGSNGAGKTTLLRVISGFVPAIAGSIHFNDVDLLSKKPYSRAALRIAHIPQGRGVLGRLTVKENLELGIPAKQSKSERQQEIESAFQRFPILKERQNQVAGSLSGGEQQMLAIARALMMKPLLIMMDEPSLGLAPIIVDEVFEIISDVAKNGISILVVEQNLVKALSVATVGYVLENGQIVKKGNANELLQDEEVKKAYLGV